MIPDSQYRSRILAGAKIPRAEFDPTNKVHCESLHRFLQTGNWGKIQFEAEFPYVTVPETVMRKFCEHMLKNSCQQS